jgi:hypothetical protein
MALIEFDGLGDDLVKGLTAAREATVRLREETAKENEALKKMGAEGSASTKALAQNMRLVSDSVVEIAQRASVGQTLNKGLSDAGRSAEALDDSIDKATDSLTRAVFASDQLSKSQRQIRADALKVTEAAAQGKIPQEQALKILEKLSLEYRDNAVELAKVKEAAKGVSENLVGSEEPLKSLRTQLKEAKADLDRLIEASDGKITPELISAAQRAGELSDRMGDLNATVEAFNPDTQFKSLIGILGNAASGAQAFTAGLGLLNTESEDVNRSLLKIQQTTAFFQGLQGFVGGLVDNWKNLKTVIAAATAATQADSAAKAANAAGTTAVAGANTAAAGATGVFTAAVNGLKAALLANPLTATLIALSALALGIVAATSDTKDYAAAVNQLSEELDALTQKRLSDIDQRTRLKNIEAERQALAAGETEDARRRRDALTYENNRAALVAERLEYEANMLNLINELESLRGKDSESAIEGRKKAIAELERYSELFQQTDNKIKVLESEYTNTQISNRNKETAARRSAAEDKRRIEEQLVADILSAQTALANKLAQLDAEGADPRRKIELQREASIEEIRLLEQNLQRKIALSELEERIGVERYKALSEAQKIAQADALIDEGAVTLGEQQQEQIASAQFAVWDKYWQDILALDQEQRAARLDIEAEGFEKDRALFDAQLAARVQKAREAGASLIEIEAFIQRERDSFRQQQVGAAVDQEEALALARVEAQARGAESEVAFRNRIELEKLAIQEQFAQRRLALIQSDGSEEAELTRLQLEKVVNEIQAKREELQASQPKTDLFSLLGITATEEDKQRILGALQEIGTAIQDVVSISIEDQQRLVEQQISATDQLIEDQVRRRDELQAQLEQELEAQKQGYANNVTAIREQIAATQEAEESAVAKKQELLAQQKRIAKQEILIDTAAQASSLAVAAAKLIKEFSTLPFGVGIPLAAAQIASLYTLFRSVRSRLKTVSSSDGVNFRHGGYLEGNSHEMGGVPVVNRAGHKVAEAEGGEFFVNRKSTQKYRDILEAINKDVYPDQRRRAIEELMDSAGVSMDPAVVRQIVVSKERVIENRDNGSRQEMEGLRKEVRSLRFELEAFREQEASRETVDGNVTIKPGKTTKRR